MLDNVHWTEYCKTLMVKDRAEDRINWKFN